MSVSTRPEWETYFLDIAENISARGSCNRLKVGALIVDIQNGIIATGYNGAPRGLPSCLEVGCLEVNGRCERSLHGENNALLQAGRNGASVVGAAIYSTHRPCYRCALLIVQAGIDYVVYRNDYDSDSRDMVAEVFRTAKVSLRKGQ